MEKTIQRTSIHDSHSSFKSKKEFNKKWSNGWLKGVDEEGGKSFNNLRGQDPLLLAVHFVIVLPDRHNNAVPKPFFSSLQLFQQSPSPSCHWFPSPPPLGGNISWGQGGGLWQGLPQNPGLSSKSSWPLQTTDQLWLLGSCWGVWAANSAHWRIFSPEEDSRLSCGTWCSYSPAILSREELKGKENDGNKWGALELTFP